MDESIVKKYLLGCGFTYWNEVSYSMEFQINNNILASYGYDFLDGEIYVCVKWNDGTHRDICEVKTMNEIRKIHKLLTGKQLTKQ